MIVVVKAQEYRGLFCLSQITLTTRDLGNCFSTEKASCWAMMVQMDMGGIYKVEGDCGQVKFLELLSSIYILKAPFT